MVVFRNSRILIDLFCSRKSLQPNPEEETFVFGEIPINKIKYIIYILGQFFSWEFKCWCCQPVYWIVTVIPVIRPIHPLPNLKCFEWSHKLKMNESVTGCQCEETETISLLTDISLSLNFVDKLGDDSKNRKGRKVVEIIRRLRVFNIFQ